MNGEAKVKLIADVRAYIEGMQRAQDKTAGLDQPEE